jgi:hypothetical protein
VEIPEESNDMTQKEQYEARKADRNKRREATEVLDDAVTIQNEIELIDIFDRMATAFERIADALEAGR